MKTTRMVLSHHTDVTCSAAAAGHWQLACVTEAASVAQKQSCSLRLTDRARKCAAAWHATIAKIVSTKVSACKL